MAKEYIERDATLRYLADLQLAYYAEEGKEREYAVMDAVFEAMAKVSVAAAVVEVVRCGVCEYYRGRECKICTLHQAYMGSDDFCSCGEKKNVRRTQKKKVRVDNANN